LLLLLLLFLLYCCCRLPLPLLTPNKFIHHKTDRLNPQQS
jgi:hypothetical protein